MTSSDLAGRTALVTGGAGGIGRAVCAELAGKGAAVVIVDRDPDAARAAEEVPGGRHLPIDLDDPGEVEAGIERLHAIAPRVDILVHGAGIAVVSPFTASDPADWDRMWRVNVRAPMRITQALLPAMTQSGFGRLVFISSDGARAGSAGEGAYTATKAALLGLAKTLARETAAAGVTSNAVCPGPTDTPMLRSIAGDHPGLVAKLARQIPARRLGTPADVAAAVGFLCTPAAGYITGQTLSVSGGITMH
ncbi:SDR family NAD(P)-dependent oxidoreductase [Nocardiopsis sediminis]|uniref:SDR family NAD(P)-dependent oxidoreductase n=1 Tax=Nocardiopsis sediminis TaxID=1778267 RepID=A0ABV8FVV8_9ACTN